MSVTTPLSHRRWASILLAVGLSGGLLAGCGGGDDATDTAAAGPSPVASATAESFPVSVLSGPLSGGEPVTIPARPERIVSLSATATETLWAVGAGEQVVAVDDQSDYPEGVPTTDLSGYTPNVEAILGYEPDLVVTSGDDPEITGALDKAGIAVLSLPSATDLEEAYSQTERIGAATGHVAESAQVVGTMQAGIAAAVASVPKQSEPVTYFHELDPTLYTVTSSTFIGEVYRLFGMESIADAAGTEDAYPQLSPEFVVEADPAVVLLSDAQCCDVTPEKAAARPGWADLQAVQGDRVIVLDEDVASRWGPRVVELAQTIAGVVKDLEPATSGG